MGLEVLSRRRRGAASVPPTAGDINGAAADRSPRSTDTGGRSLAACARASRVVASAGAASGLGGEELWRTLWCAAAASPLRSGLQRSPDEYRRSDSRYVALRCASGCGSADTLQRLLLARLA